MERRFAFGWIFYRNTADMMRSDRGRAPDGRGFLY